MENKTAAEVLSEYYEAGALEGEETVIIVAMEEYASLQCAEMKEERDKAIAAYNSACQRIDDKQALNDSLEDRVDGLNNKYADAVAVAEKQHTAIKQMKEENERLKASNERFVKAISELAYLIERIKNG